MRVIGGRAKGRRLASLRGLSIRPTSDRVREAIFNLIGPEVPGSVVLDLFAGTGSLGIEALSRGAQWALFVDHAPQALEIIKTNLALCGFTESARILERDLETGLPHRLPLAEVRFDLVFIDPPYGKGLLPGLLTELFAKDVLASPSIIVTESSKRDAPPLAPEALKAKQARLYGDTRINLYSHGDDLWRKE